MTAIEARRQLSSHAQEGNWRLKGLLLASIGDYTAEEVAKAWPSAKKSSDYRILSRHNERTAEQEQNRTVVAEKGTERYRILKDYASESVPKTLSAAEPEEIDDRTLAAPLDDTIKRTLFASSTHEEIGTLFREQLMETVMEGSRRRQIARDVATVQNVGTKKGDVPVAQDDQSGRRVAEGAEIRDDGEDRTTLSWDTVKVSSGSRVTDEMVDHAMIDLIEREVEHVGRAVENSVNEVWLTNAVDKAVASGSTVEYGGDGYSALNEAYGQIDRSDFIADTFVTSPGFRTEVFSNDALRFAHRSGSDEVLRERAFDPLLDMEHVAASLSSYDDDGRNVVGGGDNTWEFTDENGDTVNDGIGAFLTSTEHNYLFLYNPNGSDIEVKDYEDPVRDLRGWNARIHVDMDYTQARSSAVIQQPSA